MNGRHWTFYGFRKNGWSIGWWFIGFDVLSLGINIGIPKNIEIHLPFGFFIVGHSDYYQSVKS